MTPDYTVQFTGAPVTPHMMFFGITGAIQIDGGWRICNGPCTLTVPKHIGEWLTQKDEPDG